MLQADDCVAVSNQAQSFFLNSVFVRGRVYSSANSYLDCSQSPRSHFTQRSGLFGSSLQTRHGQKHSSFCLSSGMSLRKFLIEGSWALLCGRLHSARSFAFKLKLDTLSLSLRRRLLATNFLSHKGSHGHLHGDLARLLLFCLIWNHACHTES